MKAENDHVNTDEDEFRTAADLLLFFGKSYADGHPSSVDFPIINNWCDNNEGLEQINSPLLQRMLGDPHFPAEKKATAEFMNACRVTAVSGSRSTGRSPNAGEVEALALVGRIAEAVPLLARFTMEERWEDARMVMNDLQRNMEVMYGLHGVIQHAIAEAA
jgi:hypothetical protein